MNEPLLQHSPKTQPHLAPWQPAEKAKKRSRLKSFRKALGIEVESPEQSEDLERRARPEGERPNKSLW